MSGTDERVPRSRAAQIMDLHRAPAVKMFWAAATLLGLLLAGNVWLYAERFKYTPYDGNLGDVQHMVLQLTDDISKLTSKHSRLQGEMSLLSDRLLTSSSDADAAKEIVYSQRVQRHQHNYDKYMRDFALESAGARVVDTGATYEHVLYDSSVARILHALTSFLCRGCDGARAMLHPGSLPGECWAFKGSRGEAVVQLLGCVKVTGVSVEHIPADIAPTGDISSAPRRFQLEGLEDLSSPNPHDFGKFEYERRGRPIQYFEVERPVQRCYNLVRVRIHSNWGHPVFTCVYRVRVHGELAPGQGHIGPTGDFDL